MFGARRNTVKQPDVLSSPSGRRYVHQDILIGKLDRAGESNASAPVVYLTDLDGRVKRGVVRAYVYLSGVCTKL